MAIVCMTSKIALAGVTPARSADTMLTDCNPINIGRFVLGPSIAPATPNGTA